MKWFRKANYGLFYLRLVILSLGQGVCLIFSHVRQADKLSAITVIQSKFSWCDPFYTSCPLSGSWSTGWIKTFSAHFYFRRRYLLSVSKNLEFSRTALLTVISYQRLRRFRCKIATFNDCVWSMPVGFLIFECSAMWMLWLSESFIDIAVRFLTLWWRQTADWRRYNLERQPVMIIYS